MSRCGRRSGFGGAWGRGGTGWREEGAKALRRRAGKGLGVDEDMNRGGRGHLSEGPTYGALVQILGAIALLR